MAKLIKEIHDLIDYVADKGHTSAQRRGDIDQAVYEASMSLFNEYLAQYELTSTIHEYLSVFEEKETFSTTDQRVDPNSYQKPDDYARYTMILTQEVKEGETVVVEANKNIEVVNNAMWANRINDPNEGPDEDYPICRLGNEWIDVLPETVKPLLYYLHEPVKPYYSQDDSGVYDDSSSTDVEWSATLFHKLANQACSKLGINLREEQIVQYSNNMKAQGN